MEKFLVRYHSKITGILSTFDRMIFKRHILSFFQKSNRHYYLFQEKIFGRPVVAFDVGGPREWLVDGKTGFLVKRGDVKEFSLRIEQLLEDAPLAKRMGLEGQRRVNERYRKEIHLKRLLSIYEEVIQIRRQKGL